MQIKRVGAIKCLGVYYDVNLSGTTQREESLKEMKSLIAAARYRNASADTIKAVFESSVLNKITYRGVLSGWSLAFTKELGRLLAQEYRRRTRKKDSSQGEQLFQPPERGGLGFKRVSDAIQRHKQTLVGRLLGSPPSPKTGYQGANEQSRVEY